MTEGFRSPRILFAFALATLIWGSTWFVILGQIGPVPAPWSVTYRFALAAALLFGWAAWKGATLRIGREGHGWAALFGVPQFCLNYNAVYAAEHYITSGLVAVVFALLILPNSLLARLFLRHRMSGRFLAGSAVAVAGVVLLFAQEVRTSAVPHGDILVGIGLAVVAILSASAANTMQGAERLRSRPIASMLAWGMAYGVLADAALAWALTGPPRLDPRPIYWAEILYLSAFASALAFALYYEVIRAVGPGKAAYSSLLVPVLAMALSTLFEGYRWSAGAAAGALLTLLGLAMALRSRRAGGVAPPSPPS